MAGMIKLMVKQQTLTSLLTTCGHYNILLYIINTRFSSTFVPNSKGPFVYAVQVTSDILVGESETLSDSLSFGNKLNEQSINHLTLTLGS